ncbi:nucleotidyltransferase domain-containing protein [Paenibacillus pinihumi]|uniref:nucleotidyltransferase domain-containing protein n=1 Tax=Paenibacillus pinihumi TaxID=669462 RepID=UPI00048AFD93|nr:nucleotidyltransferase domain-containing protein [Paenibacillus pinihumi]
MSDMRARIQTELLAIEQEEQVRILYACESGSRAWGFPSRDSDYDVRFIYIRPAKWYLSIFEGRDVIERPVDGLLDVNGWDLKKALRLFRKSNPPLLEWLHSPIQYMEQYSVAEQIRKLSPLAFAPKSCMYHYLNMAKGNYRDYLQGEQVKIKKYFYVLRPVLACAWIEQFNTMPPLEFPLLVQTLLQDGSQLRVEIEELLVRKRAGEELDKGTRIGILNDYLEERITYYDQLAASMEAAAADQDEQLDQLFLSAICEVWGRDLRTE